TRTDSKARITEIFGTPRVGFEPREVYPNIFAVNLDADSCMKDYVVRKVRIEMIYNAAFRFPFVRNTMNFFPGIKEFMIMYQIMCLEGARDRSGKPRWDLVIFDGPTTGHSLFYLQCAKVLVDILQAGPFYRDALKVHETIIDPQKTCFNVVTLAEEMPVNETIELIRNAKQVLDVPLGYVFINAVQEHVFQESNGIPAARPGVDKIRADAAGAAKMAGGLGGTEAVQALLECAAFQTERADLNRQYIDKLLSEPMRFVEIPFIYSKNFDLNTIDGIAKTIGTRLDAPAGGPR
ncbi:MAG: ArsA-related P-loop ATPase, partial [Bdellovibrionota bacterium]